MGLSFFLLSLTLLPPLCASSSFCTEEPGAWRVEFQEDFDQPTLNLSRWTVTEGVGPVGGPSARADCAGAACIPLGSCREAVCTADNVYLSEGRLILRSQRQALQGRSFTTGGISSYGKATWATTGGAFRLCISAILPGTSGGLAQGLWPAHWLMPSDNSCDPDEGEIDVLEMVDGDGSAEATYHWQSSFPRENCTYPKNHSDFTAALPLKTWGTEFHEYSVEHAQNYLAFVYDGAVLRNESTLDNPDLLFWPVPWYLILNTAIGGSWPGQPNASTLFPAFHIIDSVKVLRRV